MAAAPPKPPEQPERPEQAAPQEIPAPPVFLELPRVDERDLALGRLYGLAMFELAEAAGEANAAEELLAELLDLAALLDREPALDGFFASPLVDEQERAELLEKLLRERASDLLVDSLQVINRKGRLGKLRTIAMAFRAELRERRGLVDALVTSAVSLAATERASLEKALARFTGKRPELLLRIDPSILGGLVVEVAGQKIEASVAARLRDFAAALTRRAEREITGGAAP